MRRETMQLCEEFSCDFERMADEIIILREQVEELESKVKELEEGE